MNETFIAWFESLFNITYLVVVWFFVYLMSKYIKTVEPQNRKTAGLVRMAFILLAAGDTGHVGFRVLAHLLGGIDTQVTLLGTQMSLVGLGSLATAYTVTLFYMLFVYVWQSRYQQKATWFTNILLAAGVFRLAFMALPANNWGSLLPPQPVSLYRNLPLILQGIGIMGLILYSAYRSNDTPFKWIGWMIAVSYAFYLPVILFAHRFPLIGMLMIPKTCAYLVVAWIAYKGLWQPSKAGLKDDYRGATFVSTTK